jgi:hypothetical protein
MLVAGAYLHVFIPKLIAFPHCDPTAFPARRPQPLLLTNPAPALRRKSTATRAVVPRHLRNFACTLREVEYIWLSQKNVAFNFVFSLTNRRGAFIAQLRLFAYKPRCSAPSASVAHTSVPLSQYPEYI